MVGEQGALVPLKLEGTEAINSLFCYTLALQMPDGVVFSGNYSTTTGGRTSTGNNNWCAAM